MISDIENHYLNLQRPRKYRPAEELPRHIYMLVDPFTDEIRYVGKAVYPKDRLKDHLKDTSNTHKVHWIQSVIRKGAVPIMVLLETIEGSADWTWQEAEKRWIAKFRAMGARLVNSTDGGDGVENIAPESKEKMLKTWTGRKHTTETKKKISAYRKTWKASAETRAAMSAAHTGREITWGNKISEATRKLSEEQCNSIRLKKMSGEKISDIAQEFGVHKDTIRKVIKGTYFMKEKDRLANRRKAVKHLTAYSQNAIDLFSVAS